MVGIFQNVFFRAWTLCSPVDRYKRFGGTCCFHYCVHHILHHTTSISGKKSCCRDWFV